MDESRGYELLSDSIGKLLGYVEIGFDKALGISEGWSVQLEHKSGTGFNVTEDIFDSEEPSKAFLEQALLLDDALIHATEEPRFIVYGANGRKEELPIFELDQRSLKEQIAEASRGNTEKKVNIYSVLREVFER
ncbi:MAG: hypothetical protein KDK29_14080 [Sedimentitalea sp.]|nr:hypothetical protein [Sedimentitalea sp.]